MFGCSDFVFCTLRGTTQTFLVNFSAICNKMLKEGGDRGFMQLPGLPMVTWHSEPEGERVCVE